MTHSDEYNGWTNRSTWLASLHLDNDYHIYNGIQEWIADEEPDVRRLADHLHGVLYMMIEELETTASDMLAVGTVWINWEEIASGMLEEAR